MSTTGQPGSPTVAKGEKGYRGLPMEGFLARWYARNTQRNLADYRQAAERVSAHVPRGGSVLEVAPGPGYLAIELARLGTCRVTGIDVSHSFVEMAAQNAKAAGVAIPFYQGDAAAMPLADDSFHFIICRAAFKNFSRPVPALDEMHRVLKPGGVALIDDLSKDASMAEIKAHVRTMHLGPINAVVTRFIFKHLLLKRAYTRSDFERLVRESRFGTCRIEVDAISLHVWLEKQAKATAR